MTRRRRFLVAAGAFFLLTMVWLVKTGDSTQLIDYFDKHPRVRSVVRGACVCVGLEGEFDKRFGGPIFYVRFTN